MPSAFTVENGSVLRLGPDAPAIIDHVPAGRLALDGNRVVPIGGETVRGRIRAMWNGFAVLSVPLEADGRVGDIPVSTSGLFDDEDDPVLDTVRLAVREALAKLSAKALRDDELVAETARIAARRAFREALDKRPVTRIHLIRTN